MPATRLEEGAVLHGFRVKRVTPIPEQFMVAYEFVHDASGARMVHLHSNDSENLFSVSFPTPPPDDTGLPHIMEHSVLAGSERFPVRDPFFEMYKMSMATFINAMTGQDCTFYPVSSNVRQDLFNLADVYFDAVFHPLLARETMQREGHHLAPKDPNDPLGAVTVNGIVYNEMKSYYSQPETRLWREISRNLFPDTCYGRESGGDPDAIPDLAYEQFREFHRRWYHPSNARFVTYGDIPPEDFLAFLEPRLAAFSAQDIRPEFPLQPPFDAPRSATALYDLGDEDPAGKTYLHTAWAIPFGHDAVKMTLWSILSLVLCGDDAAPLKRALIDSGLGTDVMGGSADVCGAQLLFSVGLKDSDPEHDEAFRALVVDTLRSLVRDGIPSTLVESAFRRFAYSSRAITSGRPRVLASAVLGSWIFGGDPLEYVRKDELLDRARARLAEEPRLLESLIQRELLNNPHRLDLRLLPDREWQKKADAAFEEKMRRVRATLGDDDMRAIAEQSKRLAKIAATPNSPEALATLPQLTLADLPPEPVRTPRSTTRLPCGATLVRNDVFSNGIAYLDLFVEIPDLDADLFPYVGLHGEIFGKMGAAGRDFAETARRASAFTGGIGSRFARYQSVTTPGARKRGIAFNVVMLDETADEALALLADKILAPDLSDRERFRNIVEQLHADMRTSLLEDGPEIAVTQLAAEMSETGYLNERIAGLSFFRLLDDLNRNFDEQAGAALDAVARIQRALLNRNGWTASFTGSDAVAEKVSAWLGALLARMPDLPRAPKPTGYVPREPRATRTGFAGPMQIAHCAQIMRAPHISDPRSTLLSLGMAMLRVDYMIAELRFKGNAYGANCKYSGQSESISLTTFADPNVKSTLDTFAAITEYVRKAAWTPEEITRGILTTARGYVAPVRPAAANAGGLASTLCDDSDELRRREYDILRSATAEQVRSALLDVFEAGFPAAPAGAIASPEKLAEANKEYAAAGVAGLDIVKLLP